MSRNSPHRNHDKSKKERDPSHDECKETNALRESSLDKLIFWNVNKAIEKNPNLNLKTVLLNVQDNLGSISAIVGQEAEERHLSCALLAWQQLGHEHADSLYNFLITHRMDQLTSQSNERESGSSCKPPPRIIPYCAPSGRNKESDLINNSLINSNLIHNFSAGPVLKLPNSPKVVMRVDNMQGPGLKRTGEDIKSKIEKACCLETGCVKKLAEMDKRTKELRLRLGKLARREAERIELLERAESAWRDLEMGYMRRHRACVEKEEEIARKSAKLIEDRNNSKEVCSKLVQVLKPRGEAAEKARAALKEIETKVCARACDRLKQSELSAKEDAILADLQCQSDRQDRDLQFKEEAARRRLVTMQNDLESTRGLMYETGRALMAELKGYKDQIKVVGKDLLEEDTAIEKAKKERDELLKEKNGLTEDLEGCQRSCDSNMQKRVDDLRAKREKLQQLKDKILDCQCKLPINVGLEVKRTPSLAALCSCSPEDKALKSCSCTSLRSRLLCDLFSDLFTGLQAEMGDTALRMPCQLLKCLEDTHSWDKASVTRTNLRTYFTKLLVGELDIAIINCIEKYHAKWVGASCADIARPIPDLGGPENLGWEDRAIAQKTQWMAKAMAEEMFKAKVDEIMAQAKEVVAAGPPPCTCGPPPEMDGGPTALYQCFVEPPRIDRNSDAVREQCLSAISIPCAVTNTSNYKYGRPKPKSPKRDFGVSNSRTKMSRQRTQNDVVLLRAQLAGLNRETIKKQDLKMLEKNIAQLVQRVSRADNEVNDQKVDTNVALMNKNRDFTKPEERKTNKSKPNKPAKSTFKRQYAVHTCFCTSRKKCINSIHKIASKSSVQSQPSTIKKKHETQSKPIAVLDLEEDKVAEAEKVKQQPSSKNTCGSTCACFNKVPSCSSIDKFLDMLTKWKYDLNELPGISVWLNSEASMKKNDDKSSIKNDPLSCSTTARQSDLPKHSSKKISQLQNSSKPLSEDRGYSAECNYVLPATQSEYVGAVNLERSNDVLSKCFTEKQDKIDKSDKTESTGAKKGGSNCKCKLKSSEASGLNKRKIKSEEYENQRKIKNEASKPRRKIKSEELYNEKSYKQEECNDQTEIKKWKDKDTAKIKSNSPQRKIGSQKQSSANIFPVTDKNIPFLISDENCLVYPTKHKQEALIGSNAVFNSKTALHQTASDCDQIKLIGVTLANTNCDMKSAKKPELYSVSSLYQSQKVKSHIDNIYTDVIKIDKLNSLEESNVSQSKDNENDINAFQQQPICHCYAKIDEIKCLLDGLHGKFKSVNQDKALDTNSCDKDNSIDAYESCVCCIRDVDDTSDLEVNVFRLLEEYLLKRLEKFKDGSMTSPIQSEGVEKLVAKMFQKIKDIIAESTGSITCACSENNNDNNWQRAYNLLQEYIKIKIDRVQCTCSSLEQSQGQAILPELTNKVCNLIEKDFERLKDICNRKIKKDPISNKSSFNEEFLFQVPEKDKNAQKIVLKSDSKTSNKQSILSKLSQNYIIVTNNRSAQIHPIFESKSCEAIKNDDEEKKTVEIEIQSSNKDCSYLGKTCSVDCHLLDPKKDINSQSTQCIIPLIPNEPVILQVKENTGVVLPQLVVEEKPLEKLSCHNNSLSLPFIGCTIDCSSNNNIGYGSCSKSKAIEYNHVIAKLWKTCGKSKVDNKDISYVMQNVYKNKDPTITTDVDLICAHNTPKDASKHAVVADVDTNTHGVGLITLKNSHLSLTRNIKHGGTNTEEETLGSETDYESIDWQDPVPEPKGKTIEQRQKKSVHFLNRSKSEVFCTDKLIKDPDTAPPNCGCSKVPICHVKMLVNDIESKLALSKCTCDSLRSEVCPIHGSQVET